MLIRLRRLGVTVAVLFALLFAVVTFTPLVVWWSGLMAGDCDARGGDVLIVLSGDAIDAQTLGVNSYWRVVYASRVWNDGKFRRAVVSGEDIAPVMRDLLVARGVPADAITVENQSRSTRENALYTARLLQSDRGRKVLVTSDVHMYRSRRVFEAAGMHVTGAPFPYGRKLGNHMDQRWGVFVELLRETVKTGYYGVRGWL
ncbi:MAG TPA: YdcF family protein [Bryobacteraceae bacterium]|nr:YdcF family protein [Bryobacteraceae bacterium]